MSGLFSRRNAFRVLLIAIVVAFISAVYSSGGSPSGRSVRILYAASGGAVDVQIGDGSGSLVMTPGECQSAIATNSRCTATLEITNVAGTESVPFGYGIEAWADTNSLDDGTPGSAGETYSDCFFVTLVLGTTPSTSAGTGPFVGLYRTQKLQPGATESWSVGIRLRDDNICMGKAATLIVAIQASDTAPTPTPTITPTITVTPTPTATATFVPFPTATIFAPLANATATPVETQDATPTVVPPSSTPFAPGAVVTPTPTPTPETLGDSNPGVNFLTEHVPSISDISTSPAVIATNLTLALSSLVIILLGTTIFNATLKENAIEIGALGAGLKGHATRVATAFGWSDDVDEDATPPGWMATVLKPLVILVITGLIYSALQPGFGWNNTTLVLVTSMIAGIAASTFLFEGGQVLLSSKHYKVPAVMRIYPLAIMIALASVLVTKFIHLQPGVVFGFVAAAAILPRATISSRAQGMIVLVPVLALLATATVSFLLIEPFRDIANTHNTVWAALPETIAVALFVCGAQGTLLILIPVTFNDGEKIWAWNKFVWLAVALPATFMFFHVMVNSSGEFDGVSESAPALLAIAVTVVLVTAATWLYFRHRSSSRHSI